MRIPLSVGCLCGAGLLLAACAGDPAVNSEAKVELAPMPKPANLSGEFRYSDKGQPYVIKQTVSGDGNLKGLNIGGPDDGCGYTVAGWFAPSVDFTNCGGRSGFQAVTKSGEIWPLEIGKTEIYDVKGQNDKNEQWQMTRRCEVTDAVMVRIKGKQLPTYEVTCNDASNRRLYYVSPELQQTVKFKRYNKKQGLINDVELVVE